MKYFLISYLSLILSGFLIAQGGEWSAKANMPTARKEIANAAVNMDGQIYVVGGRIPNGNITNNFEVYDPVADQWSSLPGYPVPVWRATAAAVDGKIYVFGGYQILNPFPFNPTNKVYAFDPAMEVWEAKANMPVAIGSSTAVVMDGKIHLIGGASNNALSSHRIYDPESDGWSTAVSMQHSRSGGTASVLNGKIYAMGGYFLSGGVQSRSSLEVYDPASDSWAFLQDMPIARLGIASAVVQNRLYVFGGATDGLVTSRSLVYNPTEDEWASLPTTPEPVSFAGVTAVGDTIYLAGGGAVNLSPDGIDKVFCFVPELSTAVFSTEKTNPISISLFPNPAAAQVHISFQLEKGQHIRLGIYQANGQLQSELINGVKASGKHELIWRAPVPGFYFIQIQTTSGVYSKKLLAQ